MVQNGGDGSAYAVEASGAREVAARLGLSDSATRWLEGLGDGAGARPRLPDDAEADRLLTRLGVDAEDRAAALAARPDPDRHPDAWWVLERAHAALRSVMGAPVPIEGFDGWPGLPPDSAVLRFLSVWIHLATLPAVRAYHAERGIPDDVSWASLELGDVLRANRAMTGHRGLTIGQWSQPLRFRGAEYRVGRLGYNRGVLSTGNGPCGFALSVHIPGDGPLDPAACDASLARARRLFATAFPEEPVQFVACRSWLMDPQLAEYLPAESNLIRFQRRFHLLPFVPAFDAEHGDRDMLDYVFGRPEGRPTPELLDELPQDSTLRRAYVAHLRAGRHWHARTGWFTDPPDLS